MMKLLKKFKLQFIFRLFFSTLFFVPPLAFANMIQILHTNDVHSHFSHATHRPDVGGYPRLKSMIQEQRRWGDDRGMGTIAMDAGDFTEGNIFYLAERGRKTYELHSSAGYDVVTIGNHDYLMGTKELNEILGDVNLKFAYLGANFYTDSRYENIANKIKPYHEMVVNGVKVGILGLTVDDPLYQWRIENGGISNAIDSGKKYAKILRERGNEVIIALTHLGMAKDKKLARKVSEIDIIIGGHSHTATHEIFWQKTKDGKKIPIVQAGEEIEWLGQLIFDYDKATKKIQVMHNELLPVKNKPEDQGVLDQIDAANRALHDLFGETWLNQVVGKSELPLYYKNKDVWLFFLNDAMMKAAQSDFAIHVAAMSASDFPLEGPITRRQIYNSNPRTFEFDFKYGYDVYSSDVRGVWLSLVTKVMLGLGGPMYFSGFEFDYIDKGNGKYSIKNLKSKGQKMHLDKDYSLAMCEGIVRGGLAITPWVKLLLKRARHHPKSMWAAVEDHLKEHPVVKESYLTDNFGRGPASHLYVPALSRPE